METDPIVPSIPASCSARTGATGILAAWMRRRKLPPPLRPGELRDHLKSLSREYVQPRRCERRIRSSRHQTRPEIGVKGVPSWKFEIGRCGDNSLGDGRFVNESGPSAPLPGERNLCAGPNLQALHLFLHYARSRLSVRLQGYGFQESATSIRCGTRCVRQGL